MANTATGTDGSYEFLDLAPGTYSVVQTQMNWMDDGSSPSPTAVGDTPAVDVDGGSRTYCD